MATDRIDIVGHGTGDYFEIVQRVDWFSRERARMQCWFAPPGYNSAAAYLAQDSAVRPDLECFDDGKYLRLLMSYCIKGWQVTYEGTPVPYPDLDALPDDVLNLMYRSLLDRTGIPPGGTFRRVAES